MNTPAHKMRSISPSLVTPGAREPIICPTGCMSAGSAGKNAMFACFVKRPSHW